MNVYAALQGQVAIVTGGAGGIGCAIVQSFAEECAHVVIIDRDEKQAELVVKKLEIKGRNVSFLKADVTKETEVELVASTVADNYGRIDILVNNAGIHPYAPFPQLSKELWDRTLEVCLGSVFICSKAVVPYMMSRRYGRIINISSVAALQGSAGYSHYSAAKAGILGLTKSLACELAEFRITVNAVVPGPVNTPMLTELLKKRDPRLEIAKIPLRRFGKPKDVARVVRFLASPESDWITGSVFVVDGGKHLGCLAYPK